MIGQIGPLVQVGSKRNIAVLHAIGGLAGGLVAGTVLATIGVFVAVVSPSLVRTVHLLLTPMLLLAATVVDSRVLASRVVPWSRQTPAVWSCSLGPRGAMMAWGFDLGTGMSTRLPFFGLAAVLLFASTSASVALSAMTIGAFGLSRAGTIALLAGHAVDHSSLCTRLGDASRVLHLSVAVSALVLGLVWVVTLGAGRLA